VLAVAVVQLTLWCWPGQSALTAYDRRVQCHAAALQRAWPACCWCLVGAVAGVPLLSGGDRGRSVVA